MILQVNKRFKIFISNIWNLSEDSRWGKNGEITVVDWLFLLCTRRNIFASSFLDGKLPVWSIIFLQLMSFSQSWSWIYFRSVINMPAAKNCDLRRLRYFRRAANFTLSRNLGALTLSMSKRTKCPYSDRFTKFPLKACFKLLESTSCLSRNLEHLQNYVGTINWIDSLEQLFYRTENVTLLKLRQWCMTSDKLVSNNNYSLYLLIW